MVRLKMEICGLNPYDRDVLLARIDLIKCKIYPALEYDFTLLKSYPNRISINQDIADKNKCDELVKLLSNLNFNKTEYERFDAQPTFELTVTEENYGSV